VNWGRFIEKIIDNLSGKGDFSHEHKAIGYGDQKKDGSHDHRYNRGNDRTPAQKRGDKMRRKRK
jgi:hypothetical protein